MKIEIWSDVVCPWCYVGKRNFDAALAQFEHRDEVEVVWRSYELDPNAPLERTGNYAARLAKKYGVSEGEAKAMIARIVSAGAKAGVELRFDALRGGNTFHAHRLLHAAKAVGLQHELEERLFAATFTEGEPIGDREALVKAAMAVGIDEPLARGVLDSGTYGQDVRDDEVEAAELGVRGVPFFAFDRRYAVGGAQPPEVLLEVIQQAWTERESAPL